MDFAEKINQRNKEIVLQGIAAKLGYLPVYGSSSTVLTDTDTFPYPRYYRGRYDSSEPIVAEREAGWRSVKNNCYNVVLPLPDIRNEYPNHCFQTASSTVYPCYPDYLRKYADKAEMELMINRACIPEYR